LFFLRLGWVASRYTYLMNTAVTATATPAAITLASEKLLAALHSALPTLNAAYLFGSAAGGQMQPHSDIDVAVDIGQTITPLARWQAAQALSVAMDRDVDLVDFRVASDVLRHQILTHGQRIFAKNPAAQSSYEAAVLSIYMDFIMQRAPLMADIAKRGAVYAR
jgi:uncharacterized protein